MAEILYIISVILLAIFALLVFNYIRSSYLLSQRHKQSEDIILHSIFEAIIQTDENMFITRWNRRAEEIFGWKADEVINKPINLFLKETDPESWVKYRRVLLSTGSNQEKMLEQRLAESEERNEQLINLNYHLQETREKEKKDIAHELFDELGQDLSSVKVQLSLVREDIMEEQSKMLFDLSIEKIEEIFQSLKKLSTGLMPKMIIDLGFSTAMEEFCLQYQLRTGVKTSIHLNAPRDKLTHQQEMILFQCSDELLNLMGSEIGLRQVTITSRFDKDFIYSIVFHGVEIKNKECLNELQEKLRQSGVKFCFDSGNKQSSVIFLIPVSN